MLQGTQGRSTPTPTNTPSATTPDDDLKAQERGYKLVLEREPDNRTALRGLIDVRRQLNDVEGTVAPLERLAELNPEESRFRVLLAQTKQYLGDREGAVETYRALINQEPGNVQALQGLVTLLLQENRPESAIAAIEDVLQLAPQANQAEPGSIDVVSTQLLLGQVYAEQQRYDQALNVFENLSQEHSSDFRPLVGKGLILEEMGQLDEARSALNTALDLAPAQQRDRIQILLEDIQAREAAPPEETESGE